MTPRPPRSTLFRYTTLFRSNSDKMYTAETLSGNTNFYFNNELLLKCVVYKYLFRDVFHVETIDGTKILEIKDRKSTRLNSSHVKISYTVFCLKKKNNKQTTI